MHSHGRSVFIVALTLAGLVESRESRAQTDRFAEARAAYEAGVEAIGAQRYADAVAQFERSLALRVSPVVVYNLALAHRELGNDAEACTNFLRYARQPEAGADPARMAAVDQEILRLRATLALIEVTGSPSSGVVEIDGRPATFGEPTCVIPGSRRLSMRAPGYRAAETTVRLIAVESFRWRAQLEREITSPQRQTQAPRRLARGPAIPAWTWLAAGTATVSIVGSIALQLIGNPIFDRYSTDCMGTTTFAPAACTGMFADLTGLQAAIFSLDGLAVAGLAVTAVGVGIGLGRMGGAERPVAQLRAGLGRASVEVVW